VFHQYRITALLLWVLANFTHIGRAPEGSEGAIPIRMIELFDADNKSHIKFAIFNSFAGQMQRRATWGTGSINSEQGFSSEWVIAKYHLTANHFLLRNDTCSSIAKIDFLYFSN